MFTVVINHRDFGKIVLEDVIEIHYNYKSGLPGVRIAFEQKTTGTTYYFKDILEFEAILKE